MPWHEWFPDAPAWMPWAALIMVVALLLFFLATLVANPLDAWREREFRREGASEYPGLSKSSRELLGLTLMGVAVKVGTDDEPE